MPEGDTVYRAAAMMQRALAGQTVRDFETVLPALATFVERHGIVGRTIEGAEARGKFLLVHFTGGLALLTHLRMNGSWHLYRRGERWRRPRRDMRVRLVTDPWEAVGFGLPIAEFHDARSLERSERLRHLGPDPLGAKFDSDEAAARLRQAGELPIEEALLDQRRIAGLGNALKSEVLFLAGVHPYTPAGHLPAPLLRLIVETAQRLLKENTIAVDRSAIARRGPTRNTTRAADPTGALFVYGRAGKPCRRCGTRIKYRRAGRYARSTFWCPGCQGE